MDESLGVEFDFNSHLLISPSVRHATNTESSHNKSVLGCSLSRVDIASRNGVLESMQYRLISRRNGTEGFNRYF